MASPHQTWRLALVALLLCLLAVPAAAQDDYRAVLGDQAGLFPGAEFKKIFRFPKATVVTFETGEPPAAVSAFYKKDMTARGWQVEVDDVNNAASYLLLTKKGRRCIVEAQRGLPGRTGFSLSL
ncbi:MAG: hypothetical protein ACP59X_01735 [Solidesulfovibrio sp. DCME]|uniref:hypothetical protein n=1 Tax=Solidesulfovibrio sp. DCME TaxID=3447380 RepID=UPI003D0C2B24